MPNLHLDIDSHVVHQLGDELITDQEQALLELIKNSYDADAEWCNVKIDTTYREIDSSGKTERTLLGKITVEDNGCGMDLSTIKRGWLTISLSLKRAMKAKGEVTKKHKRTPLGDKGLGRLGTIRLGDRISISTHYDEKKNGHKVAFFWSDFESGKALSDVNIVHSELKPSGKTGTIIELTGLRELYDWDKSDRIKEIEKQLSKLVSPFKPFDNFIPAITSNGREIDLARFSKNVLNTALSHFEMFWDGNEIELTAKVKLRIFDQQLKKGSEDSDFFEYFVLRDDGTSLLNYVKNTSAGKKLNIRRSNSKNWYVEFSDKLNWDDLCTSKDNSAESISNPGPMMGELYGFSRGHNVTSLTDVAKNINDYHKTIAELSGVYVYRDNFGIRLGKDWFGLGDTWTTGTSWYGLKPNTTIGYVEVSGSENPMLIEKSDREGFVDNYAKHGFDLIVGRMNDFQQKTMAALRRGYVAFIKLQKQKADNIPQTLTVESSTEQLGELMDSSDTLAKDLKSTNKQRKAMLIAAQKSLTALVVKAPSNDLKNRINETLEEITDVVSQIDNESEKVASLLENISAKKKEVEWIQSRFSDLQNETVEVYETVALGLAAESLAHEIHPLLDDILRCVQKVRNALKQKIKPGPRQFSNLEQIQANVTAIGKKITFLDPMLRTFREKREIIDLESFTHDYFEKRMTRLNKLGITVKTSVKSPIQLTVNRGRLLQVIDNIVRNSEYWLRSKQLETKEITVKIDNPKMIIWDTGPGIRPPLESSCFDMFVTDKPKGHGHGIGLYVVKQLLENDGCDIWLDPAKNNNGRKFKFVIDLSGLVN